MNDFGEPLAYLDFLDSVRPTYPVYRPKPRRTGPLSEEDRIPQDGWPGWHETCRPLWDFLREPKTVEEIHGFGLANRVGQERLKHWLAWLENRHLIKTKPLRDGSTGMPITPIRWMRVGTRYPDTPPPVDEDLGSRKRKPLKGIRAYSLSQSWVV